MARVKFLDPFNRVGHARKKSSGFLADQPSGAKARYFFLAVRERLDVLRRDDFRGTFAPFFRASERPMAIACFRLFTFRPDPLFSVPFFLRCIADFTFLDADLPYLAMLTSRWRLQITC